MVEIAAMLVRWQMDFSGVRELMYRSPTARKRKRWHALRLLAQEGPTSRVAEMLERDAHTIAIGLSDFDKGGPETIAIEQTSGRPILIPAEQVTPK